MKLSEWAKLQGISYKTAWRWFDEGKLPVPAEQMATGTILVKTEENKKTKTVLFMLVFHRVIKNPILTDK